MLDLGAGRPFFVHPTQLNTTLPQLSWEVKNKEIVYVVLCWMKSNRFRLSPAAPPPLRPPPRSRKAPSCSCPHGPSFLFSCLPPFLPSCLPPFLPSFLPSLLPSFLPSYLPSFLPFFFPSFLPAFLPSSLLSFLPSVLPSFLPVFPPFLFHSFLCFLTCFRPSFLSSSPPVLAPSRRVLWSVLPGTVGTAAVRSLHKNWGASCKHRAPQSTLTCLPFAFFVATIRFFKEAQVFFT